MTIGAARRALADALADSLTGVSVYAYPPATVSTPAVVVVPSDPYVAPITVGSMTRVEVSFRLTLLAGINNNEASLERLESLIDAVYTTQTPAGFHISAATVPTVVTVGVAELLSSEIPCKTTLTLGEI